MKKKGKNNEPHLFASSTGHLKGTATGGKHQITDEKEIEADNVAKQAESHVPHLYESRITTVTPAFGSAGKFQCVGK